MAMGPVHAVLANPDLLTVIFPATAGNKDKRKQLFRLALVCHKFCAVALDILWKAISNIGQLYYLFPRDIVHMCPFEKAFNRPPVTRDQWARFETYAWRIRKICVTFYHDDEIYTALGRHPSRRHLFAHLTCLQWCSDVSLVSHVTLMICSTLTDISFRLNGEGPDDPMADIVQAVRETCTHLQEFKYSHIGDFVPTSTAFETALDSLFRNSPYLRKVSIPTNRFVLDALVLLPSLAQLSLTGPSKSSENGRNVPYSTGPQSPDQETFVALKQLHIWSTFNSIGSLHLLLEPFRKMVSKPRVHLRFRIDSQDPHSESFAELPRLSYNALSPNLRICLEVFYILRKGRDRHPIAPVHHMTWQSFSWLLASPHLRRLSLVHYSLEIDHTAFAQMAQKWPKLRYLRLSISHRSDDPHATFRGLAQLSLLPKLRYLHLTIGPNCTISPSLLYSPKSSTSPVCDLDLQGDFPNADTLQIALFLVKHFPNIQTLQTPDPQPQSPWDEVHMRKKFLSEVLPEIPHGRALLTSGP